MNRTRRHQKDTGGWGACAGVLPKPRVVVNTFLVCDANNLTFRALAQH